MSQEELEHIFSRKKQKSKRARVEKHQTNNNQYKPECLLIDGYNVIFAWEELKALAKESLDAARIKLIDMMSNYQGYKSGIVIIVFDAYKVKGNVETVQKQDNIYIIYTKERQTADAYIERTTYELGHQYNIIVATSDALEQLIVIGKGARRISSRELELEVEHALKVGIEAYEQKEEKRYNYLLEAMKDVQIKK